MSRIHRLPDLVVNKIAAGEVVERPASAVKELVENALDAGGCHVSVDLKDAGRQLIRVRDDGTGMTAEEVAWALTRHATSKIATEADLDAIATLGFRGEALPAICAVSRFSIASCPQGSQQGVLVRGAGGRVTQQLQVAATPGTTVEVQDLFFNTPARLKFLKSPRTELGLILRLVQAMALARPAIHFQLTHEAKPALTAPTVGSLRDRFGALYGFELAGKTLDVRRSEDGITISGLVAPPQVARGSRDHITLIVNGRPVRDALLTETLVSAYRPLLGRDQFPVAVLLVELPPQEVDVNVHPTKAWVRFRAPRLIQEALFVAVQEALRSLQVVQRQPGLGPAAAPGAPAARQVRAGPGPSETQPLLFKEEAASTSAALFGAVIGQLQDTFVVSADEAEVFFIDQHVAHERVVFERLRDQLAQGPLPCQELLLTRPLDLLPGQAELLAEHAPALERLGFVLEGWGGPTVLVRALPTLLAGREARRLVEGLLDELGGPAGDAMASPLERALAFVACRAAIKAPAPLEREEMRRLLADLSATQTPYFCPHGRPIVSRLSLREIRRELRRTW